MPAAVGVSQSVLVTGVGQTQTAVRSLTARESEGRVGETLHPSRHHHAPVSQTELRRGQAHRLEAAGADLVDGGGGRPSVEAGPESCLASWSLAQSGLHKSYQSTLAGIETQNRFGSTCRHCCFPFLYLDHTSHEDLLDKTGTNIGFVKAGLYSGAAELGCRHILSSAILA